MLLSIIIPIYNIEKYVSKCLDSVVCQINDSIEIIAVDDGSTDLSGKICDEYAQEFRNIKVIHKKNGGLVSARKAGLDIAAGEYIMPLDGDDWIENGALNKLLEIIEKHHTDIICYTYSRAYPDKKVKYNFSLEEGYYNKENLEKKVYPHLVSSEDGSCFLPAQWAKIFKKDLYKKYQLSIPDEITLGEDACVTYPCVFFANDIYITNTAYYNYRYNQNSMTKSRKKGFSWIEPKIRNQYLRSIFPLELYGFKEQLDRILVHALFNTGVSHFQVDGAKYFKVKKEIKQNLSDPFYKAAIKSAKAKFGSKEYFAQFALKHNFVFLIYLYAKSGGLN